MLQYIKKSKEMGRNIRKMSSFTMENTHVRLLGKFEKCFIVNNGNAMGGISSH